MKTIGIMTSGGDAPGMNAAIRAVTRRAMFYGFKVCGINYGYAGLVAGDIFEMGRSDVGDIINRGGTMLYSARYPEFAQVSGQLRGIEQLKKFGVDALVVIGGDGSYHGALRLTEHGYNAIGLPGTIDNDIPYTDFTIGFDTAVNTVVELIDKIRDTAASHERTFVIEVMGRGAGDIALWAGTAGGADEIIVPEHEYNVQQIAQNIQNLRARGKKHTIVVLAEGVMHADEFMQQLKQYGDFDARSTVLGHVQRGGAPTARDRVLASKMGAYAVDLLKEGRGGIAVGMEQNKLTYHKISDLFTEKHQPDLELYDINKTLAK
ncbi:6-phosphofructokinase [Bombilactobacillus mellifer]|uniref:ATP-dependent 6-phosphofructokinase n=1 Tax=Bombilactobacillus mellifer TaxID=1218492 RepID=V5T700_9LACO|nr:6-phosphofructokinase [Bombilactobacillus mellifer]MBH9990677.1 6-phosphofructokinase [Lactobacillus sp. W8092]AHB59786.1 6-phosphofructokinase [Bombilactobacillus mellifer]KJY61845.1 6-phosphofructokinase [Bombilactobacillus mellifer]MCT6825663.1 6-phosphofructokinase [Bombilactobacillus mellifer]MCT6843290.1 6-phosphofructokinase [Bombilactobacillus mellifer]